MSGRSASAVICGAGMAGIAAAYHLSQRAHMTDVVLIDREPPLSLTSDKSTECYRNWWPEPGTEMVELVGSSIRQLEELAHATGNRINLNRRGYLFASAQPEREGEFANAALAAVGRGIGPLREHGPAHSGSYLPAAECRFDEPIDGCDLITDRALIRRHFPCLSPATSSLLHVRRCGWMSAQQLGSYLLERARDRGVRVINGDVLEVNVGAAGVSGVVADVNGKRTSIETAVFVNAAGPYARSVAGLVGVDIPVTCEPHVKISFDDVDGAVDRAAPLTIWTDETMLAWSPEETEALAADSDGQALLEPFPAGVHGRPDGTGNTVLLYWPYHREPGEPRFPIDWDPAHPEVVMRGMAVMMPGLQHYFERIPNLYVDGGYYAKTPENRPLIGPLPVAGAYLCCAFSGFGIMASLGAGELLAMQVCNEPLPGYADRFALSRYDDPAYQALVENWPDSGQL